MSGLTCEVGTVRILLVVFSVQFTLMAVCSESAEPVPPQLMRWLGPQNWVRDTDGPVISLGLPGEFDDTHIFAPCVALEDGHFRMWFCGSTGRVAERVFHVGLADSRDGRQFVRSGRNPVFRFGTGSRSILTPTLLRSPDGSVLRQNGKLRMFFSSTDFPSGDGQHGLHEATSRDGVAWSTPSRLLLKNVYAPAVLKHPDGYRMWYTDVSQDPWVIRLALSADGRRWDVVPDPVLKPAQAWERSRLFYPAVLKVEGVYLMWYGSYWSAQSNKTAIGMAASLDGVKWYRSSHNPVLRPDPRRPWESHYTTSQSVIRRQDGSFRIWYASRKSPPFVNKYYAINTARWSGPGAAVPGVR